MKCNKSEKGLVYRYRPPSDYAFKELMQDSFVMSSADTINDEQDLSLGFDIEKAVLLAQKNDKFIKKLAVDTKRNKTLEERYSLLRSERGKHILSYFINSYFIGIIRHIKARLLLGCFTNDCSNAVMWAHYAGDRKGFCIGYEQAKIEEAFKNDKRYSVGELICDVLYRDDVCDITNLLLNFMYESYISDDNSASFDECMGKLFENLDDNVFDYFITKRTSWSYEKEKRIIILNNCEEKKHEKMSNIVPSLVVIGDKMSLLNRYLIASICKKKKIPLYIVENSFSCNNYKLGIRPVLPLEIDMLINDYKDFLELDGIVNQ